MEGVSVFYATMNLVFLDDVTFSPEQQKERDFFQHTLTAENGTEEGEYVGFDGSQTAIWNSDGSCSVMMAFATNRNLDGEAVTISMRDFGVMSKENVEHYYNGENAAEIEGDRSIKFQLSLLGAEELDFGPSAFANAPECVLLSPFGCYIDGYGPSDTAPGFADVTMELADGSIRTILFSHGNESWSFYSFDAPKDLTKAVALNLDGVRIDFSENFG